MGGVVVLVAPSIFALVEEPFTVADTGEEDCNSKLPVGALTAVADRESRTVRLPRISTDTKATARRRNSLS